MFSCGRLTNVAALGGAAHVPATIVNDTFTDTSGVLLTAHTGETGATWVDHVANGTAGTIEGNRFRPGANPNIYRASGAPANPNYYVEGLFTFLTDLSTDNIGVAGRMVPGETTFYLARYADATGWALFRILNNVTTPLGGNFADTFASGQRVCRLDMQGSTIRMLIDGVERTSVTDTAIADAGFAGIRCASAMGTTTGRHLEQLVAFG